MRRLIFVAAVAALGGCGSGPAPHGISIDVESKPFLVTVLDNGKPVVSESKDGRLRYQLASTGDLHALTNVTSSKGGVYQVATDEPGRTATVTVTRTAAGARIQLALHPTTDIQQVYDAFSTGPTDHFLGGGEHGENADLRGKILSVEVGYQCSYAPIPFFSSTAGWGVRIASQHSLGARVPGSPGGQGCQVGDEARRASSRRSPTAPRCASRRRASTSASTSARSPRRSPTTRPTPAGRPCRRRPSSR